MPARQPRVPHFLSAPSSPPSVPQLQLLPSLLQRLEAPIRLLHPPCRLVSGVKLSPPQRMSSAQANLQQHPRSSPPRANLGSAQRWQFSRWDFWTFLPPDLGSPGGFSQFPVVWVRCLPRHSHTLGACLGPAWWGPWGTATNRDQHRDHSPAEIPGAVSGSLGKALLPKAMSNVPKFQHGEENLPDL